LSVVIVSTANMAGEKDLEKCKVCESVWPTEAKPGQVCQQCSAPRQRYMKLNPYYLDPEEDVSQRALDGPHEF